MAHAALQSVQSIPTTLLRPAAPSEATGYTELVGKALGADRFALDAFSVLSELPAIEAWAVAHPQALLARGKALQVLLRRAVADVATGYAEDDDTTMRRLAAYVRLRYQECQSVTAIARQWQLDRSALSHQLSRRALLVVTHRFLQLAQGVRWSADERTMAQAS